MLPSMKHKINKNTGNFTSLIFRQATFVKELKWLCFSWSNCKRRYNSSATITAVRNHCIGLDNTPCKWNLRGIRYEFLCQYIPCKLAIECRLNIESVESMLKVFYHGGGLYERTIWGSAFSTRIVHLCTYVTANKRHLKSWCLIWRVVLRLIIEGINKGDDL